MVEDALMNSAMPGMSNLTIVLYNKIIIGR